MMRSRSAQAVWIGVKLGALARPRAADGEGAGEVAAGHGDEAEDVVARDAGRPGHRPQRLALRQQVHGAEGVTTSGACSSR